MSRPTGHYNVVNLAQSMRYVPRPRTFPRKVIALLIGIGLAAVGVTLAGVIYAGWFV